MMLIQTPKQPHPNPLPKTYNSFPKMLDKDTKPINHAICVLTIKINSVLNRQVLSEDRSPHKMWAPTMQNICGIQSICKLARPIDPV